MGILLLCGRGGSSVVITADGVDERTRWTRCAVWSRPASERIYGAPDRHRRSTGIVVGRA